MSNQDENTGVQQLDFSLVLASSVHDMKNSLSMLLTTLEEVIAASVTQNDDQQQHFATLQYEASRINSDLIRLLSIYRLQNQMLPFVLDEHYIIDTFEDQIARNEILFQTKKITLQMNCEADVVWFYDNELVGHVVHNVLMNTARYANERVVLSAFVEDEQLVIRIEDDGDGFPAFMLDFDPTQQLTKQPADSIDSTRLGLFFSAKIASFHEKNGLQGRIHLSNGGALGGGVFSIYLP